MSLDSCDVQHLFYAVEVDRTCNLDVLVHYLNDETNEKCVINHINALLQFSSKRSKAWMYLNQLLPYFTSKVFRENGILWLNTCLSQQSNEFDKIRFNLIINLLQFASNDHEFNKGMLSSGLLKIVDICLSTKNHDLSLKCLVLCLEKYGSTCGPVKNKIETYLIQFLDKDNEEVLLKNTGKCFHFLQQVGGGGVDGINYINNWSIMLQRLCSTVHLQYNTIFEDFTELETYDTADDTLFPAPNEIPETNIIEQWKMCSIRLNNLIGYLQCMLESKYPALKNIQPQIILDVITRGLSIHKCISNESEDIFISNLLLKLHTNLLLLLGTLIACLKQNLFPFSFLVTKLLFDCLCRTKQCTCFKYNREYNNILFRVLQFWIRTAKNQISSVFYKKLVNIFVEDVKTKKQNLVLNQATLKKSNKTKGKAVASNSVQESSQKSISRAVLSFEEDRCLNALISIECLFRNVILNELSLAQYVDLYEIVTQTVMEVQTESLIHPYTNIKCQASLYKVLLAFFEQPLPVRYPPIGLCLTLLKSGCYSRDISVSQICNAGLNVLEKLAQPICPTMYMSCLNDTQSNQETIESSETAESDIKIEEEEEEEAAAPTIASESSETTVILNKEPEISAYKPCSVILTPLNNEKIKQVGDKSDPTISLSLEESTPAKKMRISNEEVDSVKSEMSDTETEMLCNFSDLPDPKE